MIPFTFTFHKVQLKSLKGETNISMEDKISLVHLTNTDYIIQIALLPYLTTLGIKGRISLCGESRKRDDEMIHIPTFLLASSLI